MNVKKMIREFEITVNEAGELNYDKDLVDIVHRIAIKNKTSEIIAELRKTDTEKAADEKAIDEALNRYEARKAAVEEMMDY